jgi:16S rRNA (guanine966-N2)-methyltransferase
MTTLRITAGTLRGRRVPIPRNDVRPTSERARQAYFNIVSDRIDAARFLDLFSGSGIFALEALSRGAASATAVELSRKNAIAIEKTAAAIGAEIEVVTSDVLSFLRGLGKRDFTLVYADPPYDFTQYDELLAALDRAPLVPGAIVAVEHRRHTAPFTTELHNLTPWRRNEYGEVWISMFSRN